MGVISGVVTYKSGQPAKGAKVSASVGGLFAGGVTQPVYTDESGKFLLTWSSESAAEVVYINGQEKARSVRNGTNTLHLHID
jgi:hypothetical protein